MDDNTQIRPFRIEVPEADLDDLYDRLDRTRWPDEITGAGWSRGVPAGYLKDLAAYWRHGFDWRAAEAGLNEFPQFTTVIDGQLIHFMHVRSAQPDALPLLITHGYPSSVVEYAGLVRPLSDPAEGAFHLVIPSLPGFGFSTPLTEPGWQTGRTARAWAELMRRLGYARYGVMGGDIGSGVSGLLGAIDGEHVAGVYILSDVRGAAAMAGDPIPVDLAALTDAEREHLARLKEPSAEGKAYLQIQGTRPQTLGYALHDSPVGQLAWIAEKFEAWTEGPADRDTLLANVSLYWFTGSGISAARFIYENAHHAEWPGRATAPVGWAVFGGTDSLIRKLYDPGHAIGHWSQFDAAGHFPALEAPALLAADTREFFKLCR
jgi:pimeloyl-ACP methyl ester carboxylesterase